MVAQNRAHVASTATVPFVVFILCEFSLRAIAETKAAPEFASSPLLIFADVFVYIIYGIAAAVYATAWRRLILLAKVPRRRVHFRFGGRETLLLQRFILICLVMAGIGIAFAFPLIFTLKGLELSLPAWRADIVGVATVVGSTVPLRFALIFPAAALEMPRFGLKASWAATKPMRMRFILGAVVCVICFSILLGVIKLLPTGGALFLDMIFVAASTAVWLAYIAALTCYLSIAFRRLVLDQAEAETR